MRRQTGSSGRWRAGRRTLALAMLAGLLMVGPVESPSVAGTCSSPGGGSTTRSLTALVSETTGLQPGVYATSIRWVRWHTRVRYGDTAVLEGQVVTQDGSIPGAAVDLLAQEAGSDEWVPVASATSDSDTGVFSFACLQPAMTTDYRAVYQGTVLYSPSEGERKVEVARRVPDSMTQVASDRFRFQGSVQPRYAGRAVLLQRKGCSTCRWSTVGRTSTDSRSGWRFLIDVSGFTGRRWFRAVVPGDRHFATGYSDRTWRLTHR